MNTHYMQITMFSVSLFSQQPIKQILPHLTDKQREGQRMEEKLNSLVRDRQDINCQSCDSSIEYYQDSTRFVLLYFYHCNIGPQPLICNSEVER